MKFKFAELLTAIAAAGLFIGAVLTGCKIAYWFTRDTMHRIAAGLTDEWTGFFMMGLTGLLLSWIYCAAEAANRILAMAAGPECLARGPFDMRGKNNRGEGRRISLMVPAVMVFIFMGGFMPENEPGFLGLGLGLGVAFTLAARLFHLFDRGKTGFPLAFLYLTGIVVFFTMIWFKKDFDAYKNFYMLYFTPFIISWGIEKYFVPKPKV